jgi:hypothetical protein
LYSLSDLVSKPAGRNPIILNKKYNLNDNNLVYEEPEVFFNFDVSKNIYSKQKKGIGHMQYMDEYFLLELFLNIDLR